MKFPAASTVLASLLAAPLASAVKYGDEAYGDIDGGRFWAFHSEGVSIVNPESCAVEQTFTTDMDGKSFPETWYDVIYMEKLANRVQRMETGQPQNGMVIINSGETRSDGHENIAGGVGEVFVFSANPDDASQPVLSQIDVGGRPVHSYGIYTRDEYWAHADADGFFYIIKLDDLDGHTGKRVQAKVDNASHGKLLWDEDDNLQRHGFATSTGERHLFVLDMVSHDKLSTYDFTNDLADPEGSCRGTHAIAYSGKNQHLYLECSGGGGVLEFDVSTPQTPVFVVQHLLVTGSLYETPDGQYVVASNKGGDKIVVLEPNGTGLSSSIPHTVSAPGKPSTVAFYPTGEGTGDYIVCAPLTGNVNKNHMFANGEIACDYATGCDGATTDAEVAAGVCLYGDDGQLLEAAIGNLAAVISGNAPFNQACKRCADQANYVEDKCTCTPGCGTCGEVDPDMSVAGLRCFDMNEVLAGTVTEAKLVAGAGAVMQGSPAYGGNPVCNFRRTYRTHKRGGKYDASVAHYPTNSIQIVNMEDQTLKCGVTIPGSPSRVTYVPPQAGNPDDSEGVNLRTPATTMAVMASLAVMVMAL